MTTTAVTPPTSAPAEIETKRMSEAALLRQFAAKHRLKTRVDVDGTTIIPGKRGHIYEYDPDAGLLGVMFLPPGDHKGDKRWSYARAKLQEAGSKIVQNADGEGAATFDPSIASSQSWQR
jgi:hypothetical protein